MEFIELLKTYSKRSWPPGEELQVYSLVVSLALCQGIRNEHTLIVAETPDSGVQSEKWKGL